MSGLLFPKPDPHILRQATIKAEEDKAWKACKARVRARDGKRCRLCGKRMDYPDPHHIISKSLGGPNTDANVVCLCRFHHDWVKPGLLHISPTDARLGANAPLVFTIDARISRSGREETVTR